MCGYAYIHFFLKSRFLVDLSAGVAKPSNFSIFLLTILVFSIQLAKHHLFMLLCFFLL